MPDFDLLIRGAINLSAIGISDGKIAEHWHNIDMLGGMVQLGAIQLPGPPATTE